MVNPEHSYIAIDTRDDYFTFGSEPQAAVQNLIDTYDTGLPDIRVFNLTTASEFKAVQPDTLFVIKRVC